MKTWSVILLIITFVLVNFGIEVGQSGDFFILPIALLCFNALWNLFF